MAKLENIAQGLNNRQQPTESALLPLINTLMTLIQTQIATQGQDSKVNSEIKAEVERLAGVTKALTEASKDVSGAAAKGVAGQVSETLDSVQKTLIAEIRAIKMPTIPKAQKQKEVDLTPVLEAIRSQPVPVVNVEGEAPPPQKMSWTFEFVRNKRSGLLEKVIAT